MSVVGQKRAVGGRVYIAISNEGLSHPCKGCVGENSDTMCDAMGICRSAIFVEEGVLETPAKNYKPTHGGYPDA